MKKEKRRNTEGKQVRSITGWY